jgi:hypothetical protein
MQLSLDSIPPQSKGVFLRVLNKHEEAWVLNCGCVYSKIKSDKDILLCQDMDGKDFSIMVNLVNLEHIKDYGNVIVECNRWKIHYLCTIDEILSYVLDKEGKIND